MVFDHQMYMADLIIRVGWEVPGGPYDRPPAVPFNALLRRGHEGNSSTICSSWMKRPCLGKIHGTSGFAERFAAQGPRDNQGRSFRQLGPADAPAALSRAAT